MVSWSSGEVRDPTTLNGANVLAVAAVGDPRAFTAQLAAFGARVELAARRDHYAWSTQDAVVLARRAEEFDIVICTLKDAVKLGPVWKAKAPSLWYLSQRVGVESGADELDRILAALAARI